MDDVRYAKGRIAESIEYITEELKEFDSDYAARTWAEYQNDRKLQKLMDRTVENVLIALIEVCGTILTREGTSAESYAAVMRKCANLLGFSQEEQDRFGKLAVQRNRLAHRYLNFRWHAIESFKETRELLTRMLSLLLKREGPEQG